MKDGVKLVSRKGAVAVCCLVARLFVTPRTIALQAPLSMGFPGKNTGVSCHCLLQGIFPTQVSFIEGGFFTMEPDHQAR